MLYSVPFGKTRATQQLMCEMCQRQQLIRRLATFIMSGVYQVCYPGILNSSRAAMEHKAGFFFFLDKYNEAESSITYTTETVNNVCVF